MAEWLVEEGIGEDRAIQLENGAIVAAKMDWPIRLAAGQVEDAVLVSRAAGSQRGTARFASGEEALVDKLPKNASEGAPIRLEVTRAAIAERGRLKRAQARPTDCEPRPAPSLAQRLTFAGQTVRKVRRFEGTEWDELFADAWSGEVMFDGGSLLFADTPAMTLIDVDGDIFGAVRAIAAALRRFDIGGSIGIDFPSLERKADRRAIDEALGNALGDWLHERTAMNGFGFVQIVARLEGPSILQRINRHRVSAAARMLLRRAEHCDGAGATLLTCHPALKAKLKPEWLDELTRRTGREVRIETDPALALEAGQAQIVPR